MRCSSVLAMVLFSQLVLADETPRVTAALAAYDAHVAELDAEFARRPVDEHERGWVKLKLAHMVNIDQYMRKFSMTPAKNGYSDAERQDFNRRFVAPRWESLDAKNTADVRKLLAIHGWFTIGAFGEQADNDAWLLVQHADQDPEFQRQVLALLEPLVAKGETRPEHYAYLFDRVVARPDAAGARKPQRYGTQGRCTGMGQWEPFEVEDSGHLDERRASVRLMPEAEYRTIFKDLCFESQEATMRKAGGEKP